MNPLIQSLFEAHVQHELAQFKPNKLRKTIHAETSALYQWLSANKLRDIISAEQITHLISRSVVELPIPPAITELAVILGRRVLAAKINRATALQDILPRPCFDASVAKIGSMENARRDFIHQLVSSSVYTEQISDVLFTGIKEYLLTENILAQKVPGLASLIKLGKFAVNKTMRPLELAVEKTVKAYIESNIGNTIRRSESSINAYFDQAHIIELGEALWSGIASGKLSEHMHKLDAADMSDFVAIGHGFWLHFRQTPYFKAIYSDLVQHFFTLYGDVELGVLATQFGVTEKLISEELALTLSHGINTALSSGFLEQRIRARLQSFYLSAPVARLQTCDAKLDCSDADQPVARSRRAGTPRQSAATKPIARKNPTQRGSAN